MRVALVCIAKNEDHYIDEWISYHKKLGFDDIFIYENNWEYNGKHDDVICIPTVGEVMQVKSYNYFISKYNGVYDWAAFIDVDEFIVLKQHKTIQEFLSLYGGVYSAIGMNWVYFGDNGHTSVNGEYSVLKRFTKRQEIPNQHIKSIVRLDHSTEFLSPHNINKTWNDTNGKRGYGAYNVGGPIDVIQINHYFCKTREEFQEKINRGRADTIHPAYQRKMEEFDENNHNEVEDLIAHNLMLKPVIVSDTDEDDPLIGFI